MDFLLGIYYRDNKAEVLEVGDKLLKYIQHAEEGALSPPGPAVQSVSLRAVKLYRESMVEGGGAAAAACGRLLSVQNVEKTMYYQLVIYIS